MAHLHRSAQVAQPRSGGQFAAHGHQLPSSLQARQGETLDRYHTGDRIWEIDTGHDLMITEPGRTAEMLLRLADQDHA